MAPVESQQRGACSTGWWSYEIHLAVVKVRRGLSAGRCNSVAVRLVVIARPRSRLRPRKILDHRGAVEAAHAPLPRAWPAAGREAGSARRPTSEVVSLLSQATLRVAAVERKERRKNPPRFHHLAFAGRKVSKLRFSPKAPWAWPNACTRASSWATKAHRPHHIHAHRFHRCPRTRQGTCARGSWIAMAQPRALPNQHLQEQEIGPGRARAIRPPRCIRSRDGAASAGQHPSGGARAKPRIWSNSTPSSGTASWLARLTPVFDQTAIEIDAGPVGLGPRARSSLCWLPCHLRRGGEEPALTKKPT